MYYILLPKDMVARRRIFPNNTKLPEPDGRTVITPRELGYLSFSLGEVEIINDKDLATLTDSLTSSSTVKADSGSSTSENEEETEE